MDAQDNQRIFLAGRIFLHNLTRSGDAQFIIATHSPILMGYPNSVILNFYDGIIDEVDYEMTDHYQITKYFLQHRDEMIADIFDDD